MPERPFLILSFGIGALLLATHHAFAMPAPGLPAPAAERMAAR